MFQSLLNSCGRAAATAVLFALFSAESVFAEPSSTPPTVACVDLLAIERFFYWPEAVDTAEANRTRQVLRDRYPELPDWLGGLRPVSAARHNTAELERLRVQSTSVVDFATARQWLRAAQANPVARPDALPRFERPGERPIGFCFGRAFAMYLEARGNGLPEASMRKIFLVGELVGRHGRWDFHSVLAVAGNNPEGWWMEDPIIRDPVLPSEWLRLWTQEIAQDADQLAMLFVAPPTQLIRNPKLTLADALASPVVGNYFRELLATYERDGTAPFDPCTIDASNLPIPHSP